MRVNVRLFARLRELAGASEFAWEMPDGATVRDVWERLAGEFPAMAGHERSMSSAVNADYSRMSARLQDGDEVAFLPPVSGGESARTV
jgi:molybdopterin converting factor subunit 1